MEPCSEVETPQPDSTTGKYYLEDPPMVNPLSTLIRGPQLYVLVGNTLKGPITGVLMCPRISRPFQRA
jgi:hypothetical protein